MPDITQAEAEEVFDAVKKFFAGSDGSPELTGPHFNSDTCTTHFELWWREGPFGWSRRFVDTACKEGRFKDVFIEPVCPDEHDSDELLVIVRHMDVDPLESDEDILKALSWDMSPQAKREDAIRKILDVKLSEWKAWVVSEGFDMIELLKDTRPFLYQALTSQLVQYVDSLDKLTKGRNHDDEKLMVQALAVMADETVFWIVDNVHANKTNID